MHSLLVRSTKYLHHQARHLTKNGSPEVLTVIALFSTHDLLPEDSEEAIPGGLVGRHPYGIHGLTGRVLADTTNPHPQSEL